MYILYGGRSSELAGLPLADVFEGDAIPYFRVDYTDLRELKNAQSIRKLPIHPELIRLGFIDYVEAMRALGHALLFPEMHSAKSQSFAATFYRSVFKPWRAWAFPNGTEWRHQAKGALKDKDVHSFRGVATAMMKGKVEDSVRLDILGHEGENTTTRVYDEEASLSEKLKALLLVSPLTEHVPPHPLRLRPVNRQRFGAKRGAPRKNAPIKGTGGARRTHRLLP
jgi:integrase